MKEKSDQMNKSPAHLFLELWSTAVQWGPDQLSMSVPTAHIRSCVSDALKEPDGESAYVALKNILNPNDPIYCVEAVRRGAVLEVMTAIDRHMLEIHHRAGLLPSSGTSRTMPKEWLRNIRDLRNLKAEYCSDDQYRLIARGPLLRTARSPISSSAESLADRFSALSVVSKTTKQSGRTIKLSHKVFGPAAASGVVPAAKSGYEKVAFVPVAQNKDDLRITERTENDKWFVDFQMNPAMNAAHLLIQALDSVEQVDIAVAPELVMSPTHADDLPEALRAFVKKPGIVVAGSGLSVEAFEGRSWNEARILNGTGAELWRQRKIWPAGIASARAIEYGLTNPGKDALTYEDTAAGDELVIVDIDSFGRCVVLICQDLEAQIMTEEVIINFQPDWVFVPILDKDVSFGRWAHSRCFSLSASSNARYLVVTSTSLAHQSGPLAAQPPCGIAVGPKSASDEDKGRLYSLAQVDSATSPHSVVIQWREGDWKQSTLA